ncbi:type VI secretion system accessory protein TagJ [Afifella marina]|uniref:Type VI secretion system protein ImpE n=1 Tax=Afifella marina DSM 2698 TaxID=1120955 RepID=A0A1G5MMR2_AFIMA|nr:type VI secretion system accessory protein TagJ [Afifella marina]MBK1623984.1 nitrogen fixation protein [Afifella marina DSM 2698]MBK1627100.1 nitrogen fixation protein [Afifella marina]MBK5918871.1 nitrogen fixation protein [Afifella marina]RAI22525.1 nitrogen fixation protein [Afifella marina DSM 2698]SCZ26505.1 type VI secretion system protein ImpE [Afifella marina DSM 2698]
MMIADTIADYLDKNALEEAIEHAGAAVRETPQDRKTRGLFIDLLILAGAYERADKQCALATSLDPEEAVGLGRLRAELRAMAARDAFFETGAVPDFPGGPSERDQLALKLSIAHREADRDTALATLEALETARGSQAMTVNGTAVQDFRDCDDRIPHALEVLTSGGAYLWIDFERIQTLSVAPMTRPRDLAFRPAELGLTDGSAGPILLPIIYHGADAGPALRLGWETAWDECPSGIIVGRGQRCFLAGDALMAAREIESLGQAAGDTGAAEASYG